MKHLPLLPILMLCGASLLSFSCTKTGDAPLGQNQNLEEVDPNLVSSARLTSLSQPMIWGGQYYDPGVDSLIPGLNRKDTSDYSDTSASCADTANWFKRFEYVPLYQDREVFLAGIRATTDSVPLLNPGKLMVLGSYKFVTDVNRGIHIYDDSDPANPVKVSFIHVPGVLDIALKNSVLFANAYNGLVSIDVSVPTKAKAIDMINNAFPPVYSYSGPFMDSLGNVAVAWRVDTVSFCSMRYTIDYMNDLDWKAGSATGMSSATNASSSASAVLGVNGSMSRFAISESWLYAVDASNLRLFGVTDERNPTKGEVVNTGAFDLETIFRSGTGLFLGSMTGMHIYDHANGSIPVKASTYSHITSCDPVVVQDGIAYVTLRSGNRCANGRNELNIIDVNNLYAPELVSVLTMKNPAGLAVEDSTLFISEGDFGLTVIDVSDIKAPIEIARDTTVFPEDVIASGGILTLIGPAGIWRMDYSDRTNLKLLSYTEAIQPVIEPYPYMMD